MADPKIPQNAPDLADGETFIAADATALAPRAQPPTLGARESSERLPAPGTWFGGDDGRRFELVELLGRGAMGAVFLARDHLLDRTVAVKFIIRSNWPVSREEMVELFKQEARATARLNHESIMRVFDLGTFEGMPFLVMEHLEGQALSSMLGSEGFDALRATRIMADVARGLAHAHRTGIAHRDLKPSNIFLVKDGRAKILDFGLARVLGGPGAPRGARPASPPASSSAVTGTPRYMSPEQWRGEAQDGRTDLWALGAIFFELLTGRAPVDSRDVHVIRDRLLSADPLPSVRQLRPDLPVEADELVARALSKEVATRFDTADEFLAALVGLEVVLSRSLRASSREQAADRTRSRASHRQVSLVSLGLTSVGSLAGQIELEALSDRFTNFLEIARTVVRQLEGAVVTSVGGRVLACFGYPVAHEDDAQRAVRAALLVTEAVGKLGPQASAGATLKIGIHTGLALVDTGDGASDAGLLQGGAPEVAMWLERHAEPGTIAVSASTAALTGWLFTLEALGTQTLDDGARPMAVFRVVGQKDVASRFVQSALAGLTPLVGRDDEMRCLADLWTRAGSGKGQFVLVSGEAGIGKSRLIEGLKKDVIGETGTQLVWQCWAYFRNAAFHPLIEGAQRSMEIAVESPAPEKLAKLDALVRRLGLDPADHVPLLANLLSIPAGTVYPALNMSPDTLRLRLIDSLATILLRTASESPTVLLVEDVHWSDASTQELLVTLLDRIAGARMLVLVTFRPEYQHTFPMRAHLHQIALKRLPAQATAAMVALASRGRTLPADVTAALVERTDGIPLFVEELTRMVVESWHPGAADAPAGTDGTLVGAIPTTLNELLLARLDHLAGAGRETAQMGAVLGREFTFRLIERCSHLDGERLRDGLLQLVEAGLIRHQEGAGGARYVFKHALVQETAYRSLLASQRRAHHLRVAETLTREFADIAEQQPELLAHHFAEGDAAPSALPYLERAGQRAVQRSAHVDATSHYRRAIDLLASLPDDAGRAHKELSLRLALGSPLMAVRGYAHADVEENYVRALELCRGLGDDSQVFPATLGLWQFSMVSGRLQTSVQLGHQLLAQAEAAGNTTSIMLARRALGTSCLLVGDLVAAREQTTRGLALYDPQQHGALAFRFGHDPGVAHGLYRGLALWLLGYADEALAASQAALSLANDLKHPVSVAFALCYIGMVETLRGEYISARAHADQAATISTEHRLALWGAASSIVRGWALAGLGQGAEGNELLRSGVAAWMRTGAGAGVIFHAAHAWGLLASHRHDEALQVVDEGTAIQDKNGEFFFHAEVLRLRGEALRAASPGHASTSEALFREAIAVARRQEARAFELRSAVSLGRLLLREGRGAEALTIVQPIHGWFTQGFGTVDLIEADGLLRELRASS